jgi:cytochrome c1
MSKALYLSIAFILALTGCYRGKTMRSYSAALGGDPNHGKELIRQYGCGACHIIPGIGDAHGLVGPPLLYFSQRTMIAGELPNSLPNLVHWIEHPREVEPKTAMPDLGLTADQATDIAAYLYTLRGPEETRWTE